MSNAIRITEVVGPLVEQRLLLHRQGRHSQSHNHHTILALLLQSLFPSRHLLHPATRTYNTSEGITSSFILRVSAVQQA
ncbi:unnamed protein product [Ectocarpus sp. 8 AP-2014]